MEHTQAALCAKAIKQELKKAFPDIKFRVKSDNFAGGNSVHIYWIDGASTEQVEQITNKYQYGHFDGMIDLYEVSNNRDDIPQAKYVTAQRELSNEFIKKAAEIIAKEENLQLTEDLSKSFDYRGEWFNFYQLVWRYCNKLNLIGKTTIKPIENYSGTVWDCYEAI